MIMRDRVLTPSLLLHAPESLLLPPLGLLHLLVLPALVEVLHHHAHEHVEHEETDDEEEGDEVQQHPGVVVDDGLIKERGERRSGETERRRTDYRHAEVHEPRGTVNDDGNWLIYCEMKWDVGEIRLVTGPAIGGRGSMSCCSVTQRKNTEELREENDTHTLYFPISVYANR